MRALEAAVSPSAAARPSTIAQLDLAALQRAGYLVPEHAHSPLAEEFRIVKRTLLQNRQAAPAGREGLIMVTSAVQGEGKTFCAINLAMSLAAEVDTAVLLVDADVLRPSVFQRLGLQGGRGLLDLLADREASLPALVLATNVPKLSLLHTGTLDALATERLASGAMGRLLDEAARCYADHVLVFDAPPLLMTTSAATLAAQMAQVVLVVEASRTSRRDVARAFATIAPGPAVMSLLNRCDVPIDGRRYGYYDEPPRSASRRWLQRWGPRQGSQR